MLDPSDEEGKTIMQFVFTFRGDLTMESAEEVLIDKICGHFKSDKKDIVNKSDILLVYTKFTAVLENGVVLNCEISWNSKTKVWNGAAILLTKEHFEKEKIQTGKDSAEENLETFREIVKFIKTLDEEELNTFIKVAQEMAPSLVDEELLRKTLSDIRDSEF